MNIDTVNQLVNIMQASTLSVMEVEQNGLRVRLECVRMAGSAAEPSFTNVVHSAPIINSEPAPTVVQVEEAPKARNPADKAIGSPMVGTFHVLPNGKAKVGSSLKKGDPVCIIEAMKVMNEILMEEDGELSFMAVEEGEMVEYGQTLFLYR